MQIKNCHVNIFLLRYVKRFCMEIKLLDCTLRDGSYVVNSFFGDNTIKDIINSLSSSGIEIVECGWLKDCSFNKDSVFFTIPEDIKYFCSDKKTKLALMFDFGKYNIDKLPQNNGFIDIIRIAFYKKSLDEMSFAAECVKQKGYEIFLQPSNILDYTDTEIEKLCKRANSIGANALYIVDSFGSMFPEDLERIMPLFNNFTSNEIEIGFHSHNSIELSFALSMQFINYMKRNIIVDSTLCGIGRGAGNTKTELITEFLYRHNKQYQIDVIWKCLETNILPLYDKYNWEYTPIRAYKGIHSLHPTQEI